MKMKWGSVAVAVLCLVVVSLISYQVGASRGKLVQTIPKDQYVAVFMTGGELFYGKIDGLGTPFPVLSNVFYLQSHQDPDTKQISNTLVRRGGEGHRPDRTYVNASQIIFIEPVGKGSRVDDLISQGAH